MSTKTSQLQIRVSPEQKAALKRLAADAGMSVSKYVLATVLPSTRIEFAKRIDALRDHSERAKSLSDLRIFLSRLAPEDFQQAVADVALEGLPPVLRNYVAAAVEQEAHNRGQPIPLWVGEVEPPEKPHFAWDVRSLRPHLMRITPLTFKRRNVFVDAYAVESSG